MKPYRSSLFVPGNRPAWMEKAAGYGADCLILDLEDSVPDQEKVAARPLVKAGIKALKAKGQACNVRVNGYATGLTLDDIEGVLEKVQEELRELKKATTQDEREKELGDVFLALVNVARWLKLDAEGAMRRANDRFFQRFVHMEKLCQERGLKFADLPIEEKEALWQEAKKATTG